MAQQDYNDLIAKYSKIHGVPEKLIRQLISVESSGNANATSPTGPRGLMQVSRAVAEEAGYSRADMYDPEKNIDAGTRYLAQQLKAFKGNVPQALLGYNQGTAGARNMLSGKTPMAQEGYNYIRNKKFSPEYRSSDSTLPIPATTTLIGIGKQGVKADTGAFDNASLMQNTPQEPQPTPVINQQQPVAEPPKEPSDAEKINMAADQIRKVFNNASTYQNTAANQVHRGWLDQWMWENPAMKQHAAMFGGR